MKKEKINHWTDLINYEDLDENAEEILHKFVLRTGLRPQDFPMEILILNEQ